MRHRVLLKRSRLCVIDLEIRNKIWAHELMGLMKSIYYLLIEPLNKSLICFIDSRNDHLKGYKSVQHVHEHLAQIRVRKGNSRNKTASPLQELFRHIGTYISKCRQFFIT